jgi:hypothetical protein
MQPLLLLARNVFAHQLSWVGGLLTLLGVVELLSGKKILVPPKWVLRVGVAFLFIACCQAWFDEHHNVLELITEKATLTQRVNQLEYRDKPIVVQIPESKLRSGMRSGSRLNIQQKSEGPNSPNIAGNGNQVTINPELNPNVPTVYYDFNGGKHVQQGNKFNATAGDETSAFQKIVELHDAKDWQTLNAFCEEQISKYPQWLTPYLYSGVALANTGQRDKAIERLKYVREKSAGREDYKDASRLLELLGQQ